MVGHASGRAAARLPQGRRRARGAHGRGRRAPRARDRVQLRLRDVPDALRAGPLPPGGRARVLADRAGDPLRHSGHDGARPAASRRRRRRDRSLERGPHPLGALDRRAARAREHGRAQALRVVARLRRPPLGRDLRGGRPPGGRAERRDARAGRRRADRRRARVEPGRAADQLHGLDVDGAQARRSGGPQPQAGPARARRLQPADRARGRGRRVRRQRVGVRRVPAPGTDLHVGPQDHRRALDRRRLRRRGSRRRRRRSRPATRRSRTRSSGRSSTRTRSRR